MGFVTVYSDKCITYQYTQLRPLCLGLQLATAVSHLITQAESDVLIAVTSSGTAVNQQSGWARS